MFKGRFMVNLRLFLLLLLFSIIFINPVIATENNSNIKEVNQYEQLLNELSINQSTSQNVYSKNSKVFTLENPLLNSTSDSISEIEPNNFEYQANQIPLNTFVNGYFSKYYDLDYYKINITESGELRVIGTCGSYLTSHLEIGLENSNEELTDASVIDGNCQVITKNVNPGIYYIVLLGDRTHLLEYETYTFNAFFDPNESSNIPVTGITLNKNNLTLDMNQSEQLTYIILPDNATNKSITWKSSNPDVISVSNDGTIKALKQGNSTITVTTVEGNKTADCIVIVNEEIIDDTVYKEWPEKTNVETNKVWSIKFNMDINSANSDNVYVTDEYNIIDTKIEIDGNIIKVTPISDYESGKTYYLIIKNVVGENNKSMKENIRMKFSVKNVNNEEELEIIEVSNINNLIN